MTATKTTTAKRVGRRKQYTDGGISRVPCARCGKPSQQQWQCCANDNLWTGVCDICDVELNRCVLDFFRIPDAAELMAKYAGQRLDAVASAKATEVATNFDSETSDAEVTRTSEGVRIRFRANMILSAPELTGAIAAMLSDSSLNHHCVTLGEVFATVAKWYPTAQSVLDALREHMPGNMGAGAWLEGGDDPPLWAGAQRVIRLRFPDLVPHLHDDEDTFGR